LVHKLSSHRLTQQQLAVLTYDAKFNTKDARPEDFIASFESALQTCDAVEECKNAKRQQVTNLILQHQRQTTISKDIVTLPADKGLSTVVVDRSEYGAKLINLLKGKESYVPSTTSGFKKLVNSINKTVYKLTKAGALTRRETLATKATDAAIARFYGLPKVHKPGVPLRPIFFLRGTPTFRLSKWLYQRLCFLTKDSKMTVKPADKLLTHIKHLEVEADESGFPGTTEQQHNRTNVPEDTCAAIRSCATGLLRQRKHRQVLSIDEEKGLRSLKADYSIVIMPADKGGATVIMEKVDYINKANQIFNDHEAYTPLDADPTKKQATALKKKVNELNRLKLISPHDSKFMSLSDPRMAHAYGLPQVPKAEAPLRIIVPLIRSPTYHGLLTRVNLKPTIASPCLTKWTSTAAVSSPPHGRVNHNRDVNTSPHSRHLS
uniref:Uncharacterized protein n=1 Tax=Schistocephalus solidus TaxID=70667 RepID=A0A183TSB0_SCHSO